MKHLSDDQIQDYLGGNYQINHNEIKDHLENCSECSQSLFSYRDISQAIQSETVPVLSVNFSKNVITKLEQSKERKWEVLENIIIALTLFVGIGLMFYFFNFADYFKTLDFSFLTTGLGRKVINTLSPNIIYLTVACLITAMVELIDRFKIQKSFKQANH